MPQDVHGGVTNADAKTRSVLRHVQAIEEAGDGSEQHVAPVGKAMLVMWEKPKRIEAVHQPASSL